MIHRIPNKKRYVSIACDALEDSRLSLQAKGILAYLLSRPDDWEVSVQQLVSIGPDGRSTVQSCLQELAECGYAKLVQHRDKNGHRATGKRWEVAESKEVLDEFLTAQKSDFRDDLDVSTQHVEKKEKPLTTQKSDVRKADGQNFRRLESGPITYSVKKEPNTDKKLREETTSLLPVPAGTEQTFLPALGDTTADTLATALTPDGLIQLYNALIPPGHPRVVTLSKSRLQNAQRALKKFPDMLFWRQTILEIGQSTLLQGKANNSEHPNFVGDFDWLMRLGFKDHVENYVKVSEGKYRDKHVAGMHPSTRAAVQSAQVAYERHEAKFNQPLTAEQAARRERFIKQQQERTRP